MRARLVRIDFSFKNQKTNANQSMDVRYCLKTSEGSNVGRGQMSAEESSLITQDILYLTQLITFKTFNF